MELDVTDNSKTIDEKLTIHHDYRVSGWPQAVAEEEDEEEKDKRRSPDWLSE